MGLFVSDSGDQFLLCCFGISTYSLRGDCIQERETLKIAFVLKSKRIQLHQTSSARDAKGTALRKGRKRERQRNTGRK